MHSSWRQPIKIKANVCCRRILYGNSHDKKFYIKWAFSNITKVLRSDIVILSRVLHSYIVTFFFKATTSEKTAKLSVYHPTVHWSTFTYHIQWISLGYFALFLSIILFICVESTIHVHICKSIVQYNIHVHLHAW